MEIPHRLRLLAFVAPLSILALLSLALARALGATGRVEGLVLNSTTRRPAADLEVRLLTPRGGMQQVASGKTDASGRVVFTEEGIDSSRFYLLSTAYQGVSYNTPVQFDATGKAAVNLEVYDASTSRAAIRVQALRVLVRVEGAKVRVQEEFDVLNSSNPPRALASPEGTFRFRLSPGASEPNVAVVGLMNMLLPQSPSPGKSPGEFSIPYPLKPGLTQVAISYETDYASSRFELNDRLEYPVDVADIYLSPATLSVKSRLFKFAGGDPARNLQKIEARDLPRQAPFDVRLSGEAAAASQAEAEQSGVEVKIVPNSMTRLGVPLLACFLLVLLWALGVRVAREWPQWKAGRGSSPVQKQLGAKADALVNSLADLDELFASAKIEEAKYWKERLELKARLAALLKKSSPALLHSYATRNTVR